MTNLKIDQPRLSILIPVFNRKDFITECIQSALNQTFTDFEVVIVDNASNDGTWEICQIFALKDSRVRIFRNEINVGPVHNWIRCAQESRGELSKILFSDDVLEPNCLSEMVPLLTDLNVAFVYCAVHIGIALNQSVIAYSNRNSTIYNVDYFINLIIFGKAPVSPGAILLRRSDLLKNLHLSFPTVMPRKYKENGAGPDVMILLLTAQSYRFVAHVSKPLIFFRVHAGSFSIENRSGLVVKGYNSAISYFLFRYCSRKKWLMYLSVTWVQKMKYFRSWTHPSEHLMEYEGKGKICEVILLEFYAFRYLASLIYKKLKSFCIVKK